jgi:hypothetical protein
MAIGKTAASILALAALAGVTGCSKAPAGNAAGASASTAPLAGFSFASDPCQVVLDSMMASLKHDHAAVMTMAQPSGAPNHSELRQVGGKTYIQVGGAWSVSQMTVDQEVAAINENKKTSTETCKSAGDDVVAGQPVTEFDAHVVNQGSVSDNRVWISKATGLPMKTEIHIDGGAVDTETITYDGVTAPAL